MADGTTVNHSFILPEIGLSKATWGTKLNQNFTALDAILHPSTGLFLARAGGTVTGQISLSNDPAGVAHATRKSYVDGLANARYTKTESDAKYVPLAGGTLTGFLNLHADPTATTHAARKSYVDTQIATRITQAQGDARYLEKTGGTLSGATAITVTPTAGTHLANKNYVDTQVATRLTQAQGDARYMDLAGGAFTGPVSVPADPSSSSHLARKGYVDTQVNTRLTQAQGDARYATLSGGNTLTGGQTVAGQFRVNAGSQDTSTQIQIRTSGGQMLGMLFSEVASPNTYIRSYAAAGSASYSTFGFEGDTGRLVANAFSGNGSLLTNLNASNVASGTLADARLPSTAARTSTTIMGGDGLVGGGGIGSDRTISLGIPSSITYTSTNSRTATSHTHSIGEGSIRQLIGDGNAGLLGTYAFAMNTGPAKGFGENIAGSSLYPSGESDDNRANRASSLDGSWKCMGYSPGNEWNTLWLRIA